MTVGALCEKGMKLARILVLSHYWAPENGVPQRRWTWLTEMLHEQGHSVSVIAPPPHYNRVNDWAERAKDARVRTRRRIRGVNKVEWGPSGERIFRTQYLTGGSGLTAKALNQGFVALSTLLKVAKQRDKAEDATPDLIIGTVPALPTAFITPLAAKLLGVPYVIDLRDAWPDLLKYSNDWNSGLGESSWRERIFGKGPKQVVIAIVSHLLKKSLRNAAGVIVTADDLGEQLQTKLARRDAGVPVNVCTVRNVFPVKSAFSREHATSVHHEESERPYLNVLYAGTLGRAQKLGNAIEAAEIAHRQGVDVHLKLIGAGVTKEALQNQARELDADIEILPRTSADALEQYYAWADTALVHLADWAPLQRAVPSKTYELMEAGIHISGAVEGEPARLIEQLHAGHTVPAEDPQALAQLWVRLAHNREQLEVPSNAAQWVVHERDVASPAALQKFLDALSN